MEKKKGIRHLAAAFAVVTLFTACASAPDRDGSGVPGIGAEFTASSVLMTAGPDWGNAVKPAEFTPGIPFQGVESVEMVLPYGETTVAWNFDGFGPNEPLTVEFAVNFDLYASDTFLYLSFLPGRFTAEDGLQPRTEIKDAMTHKWVDSIGRFAGEPWPDATDGWETIGADLEADANGEVTVTMVVGHYTENPPLVFCNLTNPVVQSRAE